MGEKSANNLLYAIEASKDAGLARVLFGLGIRFVGVKAAMTLAKHFGSIDALQLATIDELILLDDIGEKIAQSVVAYFKQPMQIELIEKLKMFGVKLTLEKTEEETPQIFAGLTFVLTGTLPTLTRKQAADQIESRGGKVSGSVSKKTSYVLAGTDAGSKLDKAEKLGIAIIDEATLLAMIEEK